MLIALFFVPAGGSLRALLRLELAPGGSDQSRRADLAPARLPQAAAEPLQDNWALVYVGDGACDDDCRHALVFARQTRLSLNKEMTRVNACFLATATAATWPIRPRSMRA